MKTNTAAIVTIHGPAEMTLAGRRRIAKWLRERADLLVDSGKQMGPVFRSRYLYTKGELR